MIVTVDTNILIWGIRREAIPAQSHRIADAIDLFRGFEQRGDTLVLTSVSVGEYLIGTDNDVRKSESRVLEQRFRILPYDCRAAVVAAQLRSDKQFIQSLKDATVTSTAIKADICIVATCVVNNVGRIYSDDGKLRAIAARVNIEALELPPARPPELPQARQRFLPGCSSEESERPSD